ncbi:DUF2497 domain-containing protein [Taklimakanibacter deserti]|uniref:DUF2497 domain-containing protein n=1 Tax=Taklimakanibacter deserti TaxID=2267839 RepID=UPI000E65B8E5
MKHGQKPVEPRMEDVLASIRRAIDENAHGQAQDRLGGSMAEFRVKFDKPANQETRTRRSYDPAPAAGASQPQGFAGILSGSRKSYGELSPPRETFKPYQPIKRPEPTAAPSADEGQRVYDGYYGAQLEEYPEPEPYQAPAPITPPRYSPPPPAVIADHRQNLSQPAGLMSEASSDATQAAFGRLAETLTRRALGERPIADVTQELLKGMLKQWLDENLPKIVERLVREEIERVVRRPR